MCICNDYLMIIIYKWLNFCTLSTLSMQNTINYTIFCGSSINVAIYCINFHCSGFFCKKNAVPTDLPVDTALLHVVLFYITTFHVASCYIILSSTPSCLLSPCYSCLSDLPSFHWLCSDQLHPQDPEE